MAARAEEQDGVVSREQLLDLGLTPGAIDARRKRGNLHRLHRGVYAVGHRRVGRRGRLFAAVLACGEGAAVSHRSAAEIWGIRSPWSGRPEVTAPSECRHPQIKTYESCLPCDEVTTHEGLPVTTPARTLLDLGLVLRPHEVEQALNQLEVLRLWDEVGIAELLDRHPRRRGTRTLRMLVARGREGERVTKRELEARFQSFVARHRLPPPATNVLVAGLEVDCAWPEAKLVVELDSRTHHLTRHAFERDRERDRILTLAGWRVVRITWRQLARDGPRLARDLRALLAL